MPITFGRDWDLKENNTAGYIMGEKAPADWQNITNIIW
jgi:hypothetical protein